MPCYDYECLTCEEIFTVTRSMEDTSIPHCIKCKSNENIKRVWKCINLGSGMSNKVSTSSSGCSSCSSGSCSTCK